MHRPLEPDDILRLQSVGDPQIAPDGARVVYTVGTMDLAQDKSFSALWLAPTGSGEPRQLTRGTVRDGSPRWSPDGQRIAFTLGSRRQHAAGLAPTARRGRPAATDDAPSRRRHARLVARWHAHRLFCPRHATRRAEERAPRHPPPTYLPQRHAATSATASGISSSSMYRVASRGRSPRVTGIISLPPGRRMARASPCVTTRRADWDLEWVWDVFHMQH